MKPNSRRLTTAGRQSDPRHWQAKARKTSRGERALVLGPFFSCLIFWVIFGVFFPAPVPGSAGAAFVALTLAASVLWIVVASLALTLDRAIRHANWSFFMGQDQAPGDEVGKDWDTRTGSFTWIRDWEDIQFDHENHHH